MSGQSVLVENEGIGDCLQFFDRTELSNMEGLNIYIILTRYKFKVQELFNQIGRNVVHFADFLKVYNIGWGQYD